MTDLALMIELSLGKLYGRLKTCLPAVFYIRLTPISSAV